MSRPSPRLTMPNAVDHSMRDLIHPRYRRTAHQVRQAANIVSLLFCKSSARSIASSYLCQRLSRKLATRHGCSDFRPPFGAKRTSLLSQLCYARRCSNFRLVFFRMRTKTLSSHRRGTAPYHFGLVKMDYPLPIYLAHFWRPHRHMLGSGLLAPGSASLSAVRSIEQVTTRCSVVSYPIPFPLKVVTGHFNSPDCRPKLYCQKRPDPSVPSGLAARTGFATVASKTLSHRFECPSNVLDSRVSWINQRIDDGYSFHAYKFSKKPAYSFDCVPEN